MNKSYKLAKDYARIKLKAVDTSVDVEFRYIQDKFPDIFAELRLGNITRAVKNTVMWKMTLEVYFNDPDLFFGSYLDKLEDLSCIGDTYTDGEDSITVNQFASLPDEDIIEVDIRLISDKTGVTKKYFVWQVPFYIKFLKRC